MAAVIFPRRARLVAKEELFGFFLSLVQSSMSGVADRSSLALRENTAKSCSLVSLKSCPISSQQIECTVPLGSFCSACDFCESPPVCRYSKSLSSSRDGRRTSKPMARARAIWCVNLAFAAAIRLDYFQNRSNPKVRKRNDSPLGFSKDIFGHYSSSPSRNPADSVR